MVVRMRHRKFERVLSALRVRTKRCLKGDCPSRNGRRSRTRRAAWRRRSDRCWSERWRRRPAEWKRRGKRNSSNNTLRQRLVAHLHLQRMVRLARVRWSSKMELMITTMPNRSSIMISRWRRSFHWIRKASGTDGTHTTSHGGAPHALGSTIAPSPASDHRRRRSAEKQRIRTGSRRGEGTALLESAALLLAADIAALRGAAASARCTTQSQTRCA